MLSDAPPLSVLGTSSVKNTAACRSNRAVSRLVKTPPFTPLASRSYSYLQPGAVNSTPIDTTSISFFLARQRALPPKALGIEHFYLALVFSVDSSVVCRLLSASSTDHKEWGGAGNVKAPE